MTAEIPRQSLPATASLTRLGTGGEGIVYDLPAAAVPQEVRTAAGGRPVVYKEFLHQDSPVEAQHHRAVVGFLGKLGSVQREWLLDRAAWPVAVVVNGGAVCGILMPKIPAQFFRDFPTPSGGSLRKEADFQMLLNNKVFLKARGIGIGKKRKLGLLIQVAELLRVLQGAGLVVGDLSARNLLFALGDGPDDPGSVYLIDCDSVSTPGSANLSVMETPGWSLPSGEKTQTQEGDRYKFALLVLRVLAGDQTTRNIGDLPSSTPVQVRRLTERTLSSAPADRPRFQEWVEVLQTAYASVVEPKKQKSKKEGSSGRSSSTVQKSQGKSQKNNNSGTTASSSLKSTMGGSSTKSSTSGKSPTSAKKENSSSDSGLLPGCFIFIVMIAIIFGAIYLVDNVIPWPWKDGGKPEIDSSWCTAADEIEVENNFKSSYPGMHFSSLAECPDHVFEDKDSGKHYILSYGDNVYLPKSKDGKISSESMSETFGEALYYLSTLALLDPDDDVNDYIPATYSSVSSLEERYVREHPWVLR